jgi:hypothetical protein
VPIHRLSGFVRPISSSLSIARLAVTVFALFAFTLQSYAMQVHLHGTPAAVAQKPGTTEKNDTAHCPICQEILHFGHYVTPSAGTWSPALTAIAFAVVSVETRAMVSAPSHGWNSRAPPSA